MAAASARAFALSRVTNLSHKKPILYSPRPLPPPSPRWLPIRGVSSAAICCLSGGGVSSDDSYVSTRRSKLDRGFAVIANMMTRTEPLDTSVISKGLSDSAKDSMKQTISSMLGLLPSDQFSVSVAVHEQPLRRLLISSIIAGYTLWNAEYRISLTRNLDIPVYNRQKEEESSKENGRFGSEKGENEELGNCSEESERMSPQVLGGLPPEALNYIQQLQSELFSMKEELDAQKKKTLQIEPEKGNKNDLLEYLRSLDPEMVTELSRPSSPEVEEIINQLVQNVLQKTFEEKTTSDFVRDPTVRTSEGNQEGGSEICRTVGTSRDYLAKLLFWCMLMGHHLRGLENRLHLSCAVGLL
ncbi:PREDICTED: uncharacterized protein LOC104822376 [Tarenaya hassleriana]|uniref:uncharacterized protein LOC104822376 n=1 Tax=Tarenaya hassleriana TaxID=28532 RepID=UPI00053C9F98|nr:PREDICTED: uncharacterized protein LOC104822376 [Tarenaya hassleriana]XP_010551877.1 PREDICTED: uncharacterized protein LOC104822376 [Tarenaya hassleriana]